MQIEKEIESIPYSDYSHASGEIIGIIKQMDGEIFAGLREATEVEAVAVKSYDELMAAKKK